MSGRDVAGTAIVVVLAIFLTALLEQPFLSPRAWLIGNQIFTAPELVFMELAVGAIGCIVVSVLCLLAFRSLEYWIVVVVVVLQLVRVEYSRYFSLSTSSGSELAIRFAEDVGVIAGGAVLWGLIALYRRRKHHDAGPE